MMMRISVAATATATAVNVLGSFEVGVLTLGREQHGLAEPLGGVGGR